ncbi:MAG: metal-dependent hydrolase [bacterium]|nr:MAG: metal-dependent hydrolase [bacterium]
MKTLIKAGLVYPVLDKPLHGGCVSVSDGVIKAVGGADDFDESLFDEVIDLASHLLLPGFVNAHSHLRLSGAKNAINYHGSFTDWIRQVVEFNSRVDQEQRLSSIEHGIAMMMESGITAVADLVWDQNEALKVARSPVRSVVFIEVISPHAKDAGNSVDEIKGLAEYLAAKGVSVGLAPHAPYSVSGAAFELLNEIARKNSWGLMTHVAETPEENEYLINGTGDLKKLLIERGFIHGESRSGTGKTPVALVDGYDPPPNFMAVHLNCLNDADVNLLAKKGAAPLFCPASSRWFGRKNVMPLEALMRAGLRPAIGTDSLASNSALSMLDELRCAAEYFPRISRARLIEMATVNGADHLRLNCGAIQTGKWADLIAFRRDEGTDPVDCVFNARKTDFLMIAGKVYRKK